MGMLKDEYVLAEDIIDLNQMVQEECRRRNLKDPLTPPPDITVFQHDIIFAQEIQNMLEALTMLDCFPDNLDVSSYIEVDIPKQKVELKASIKDEYIKPLEIIKTIVNTAKATEQISNSDCRGNCAGLCTGCIGSCIGSCQGCTSCQGGCSSGCGGCGGCGGCSNGCYNSCYGCGGDDGFPSQCGCGTGGCVGTMY